MSLPADSLSSSSKKPKLSPSSPSDGALLRFVRLSDRAVVPSRGSLGAAGFDLCAAVDVVIPPGGRACVGTDLEVGIPEGYYGRVAPRSGLAIQHGIDVGAGVIDGDFRGPIGVVLFNHGHEEFKVSIGGRVAQLVVEKIYTGGAVRVDCLDATARGSGGFGSTGV